MTDTILLAGMRFEGIHGMSDEERMSPQLLEVDLELTLDLARASASDEMRDTIDYGELIGICRRVVEEGTQRLLEGVAGAILDEVSGRPGVTGVTVRVRKPAVPVDVEMEYAQVELRR